MARMEKLKSAPPETHTIVALFCILAVCFFIFPSLNSIDEIATVTTFTSPVFSSGILSSPETIGWIRIVLSAFVFVVTAYCIYSGPDIKLLYLPKSKLGDPPTIRIRGIRTQAFFTLWCWNVLGISFFLSGLIPLLVSYDQEQVLAQNPWILRFALFSFEVAAPMALLVSAIVKYALWTIALRGNDTTIFKTKKTLILHNANSIMVLLELIILGGLPVRLSHVAAAAIFGCAYVLFSWYMINRWDPAQGPAFVYFFLDTTLGVTTTIMMIGLLAVMVMFFALFSLIEDTLVFLDGGALTRVILLGAISCIVCRFRD